MSEAIAGVPALPPPGPPRDASAVVLYRRAGDGVEVFWLKRERKLRFAGGFYAFPGGRVDEADARVPVRGATGDDARLIATAARELLEETGVLVARHPGEGRGEVPRLGQLELDELRRRVLDAPESFAGGLAAQGLVVDAADFPRAGRWLTPPFLPTRYDTRFYLVEAPPSQHAEVWPGELSDGRWTRPADALARWEEGEVLLHPPNLHALRAMAAFSTAERALEVLRAQPSCVDNVAYRIEFQRGVHVFPLRTPTLPPATHTSCVLLGTRELLVVDPGAPDDAELDGLISFLAELGKEGMRPRAVVLTHHHGDHVGGVARLVERLGLPIWAHELTASRLPWKVARLLADGEVLELDGPRPMRWRVLHTPGHARGHVCLVDEASRAAVVGDMVAGLGTVVIDPPEGDMAQYLAQLERLRALPIGTLYPAHGPVTPNGVDKLDEYLAHRAWREQKVLEALGALRGEATLDDLVPRAYDDVAAFVLPIAERSTAAILAKLEREGRVARSGERYRLALTPATR